MATLAIILCTVFETSQKHSLFTWLLPLLPLQMAKLAIIPCTVCLQILFLKMRFSLQVQASLLVLLLGVGIATVTDLELNFVGTVLAALAIVSTCVAQISFILLSCFIAVAVNFSSFLVIGKTSPVTYQVSGLEEAFGSAVTVTHL
ncbi:unnamed protein product [Closterium sp. NIES-53]